MAVITLKDPIRIVAIPGKWEMEITAVECEESNITKASGPLANHAVTMKITRCYDSADGKWVRWEGPALDAIAVTVPFGNIAASVTNVAPSATSIGVLATNIATLTARVEELASSNKESASQIATSAKGDMSTTATKASAAQKRPRRP